MSAPESGLVGVLLAVDESQVRPGLVAFLVVLGMAIALYFLLRSMSKHLRRIDIEDDAAEESPPETSPDRPNG